MRHHDHAAGRPARMLRSALYSLAHTSSVRIIGTTSILGARVHLDAVAGPGRGGGTVAVGPAQLDVVLDGASIYVRGAARSWDELGYRASAPALANHWWRTSASTKPFDFYADLVSVDPLASLLGSAPGLVARPLTKVGGIPVLPLVAAGGHGITYFVTAAQSPVLVGAEESSESITFTDYGAASLPPVPTGAKPLDPTLQVQG